MPTDRSERWPPGTLPPVFSCCPILIYTGYISLAHGLRGWSGPDGLAPARMFPRRRTATARDPRRRATRLQPAGAEPLAGASAVRSRGAIVPPRRPLDPPDQVW